ncbi:MAG TPA: hypothetical protein VD793_01035 [Gemmatimonadales bacterium]|nr:hypothetical protein [Gemmatimonadales bacterium]
MNDQEIRQAYVRRLAAAPRGTGCPSPEALLALVERTGTEEERLATLDHAMACAACRRDVDLLRSVTTVGAGLSRTGVRAWLGTPALQLAAAAVLVLAVGGVATLLLRPEAGDTVWRGSAESALVSPEGPVPVSQGARLVWRRAQRAVRYEVEVLTAAGDSLFATATPDTVLTLPPEASLLPGSDYVWSVRAVLENGTRTAAATLRFRVQP